ncbi:hypothetical protein LPA44_03750 [Halobacterium sp. KA-4]|uniref:hypothetical protein n=1 Tax=Halobacterium sp. KA-4 TaxID=2896367 RepID=UPI001E32BAC9|nr:hypothetical protein [Halobacterium sp. KA-4]MCD2199012.1 hypothetical protein [Halobacterium sp. KA-4]
MGVDAPSDPWLRSAVQIALVVAAGIASRRDSVQVLATPAAAGSAIRDDGIGRPVGAASPGS